MRRRGASCPRRSACCRWPAIAHRGQHKHTEAGFSGAENSTVGDWPAGYRGGGSPAAATGGPAAARSQRQDRTQHNEGVDGVMTVEQVPWHCRGTARRCTKGGHEDPRGGRRGDLARSHTLIPGPTLERQPADEFPQHAVAFPGCIFLPKPSCRYTDLGGLASFSWRRWCACEQQPRRHDDDADAKGEFRWRTSSSLQFFSGGENEGSRKGGDAMSIR